MLQVNLITLISITMHDTLFFFLQNEFQPQTLKPRIGSNNLTVRYIIEYENECNDGNELVLAPLDIVISKGETALHVMENAVHSANDSQYQFTTTYWGTLGYHVHTINGTSDTFGNVVPEVPCYWSFLIQKPKSKVRVAPTIGVAHYVIPGKNYTVIMWYNNQVYDSSEDSSFGVQTTPDSGVQTTPIFGVQTTPNFGMQNTPLLCVVLLCSAVLFIV